MIVEVLYFRGCPGFEPTIEAVKGALSEQRLTATITPIEVPDEKTARSLAFPGSPTVRINGQDIEPPDALRTYGLSCRIYVENGVAQGVPPQNLIRDAIRRASSEN